MQANNVAEVFSRGTTIEGNLRLEKPLPGANGLAYRQFGVTSWIIAALTGVELAGPLLAERKDGGTPWHPHHIAERYSLL